MDAPSAPDGGRLRFIARALRSGARRYPRALAESLRRQLVGEHAPERSLDLDENAALSAQWLGHASVAMRIGGVTVLADPVFSARIGPRLGSRTLGLARVAPLPIDPMLVRPDLLLLTHAHFDHLDRPTLELLANPGTVVVTAPNTAELVPAGFADVIELAPGGMRTVAGVEVRAVRARHWGARTVLDRARGACSFRLRADGATALIAGDTAHTHVYDHVGPVDLAVFGIGAYEPWEHMHATPEQAWVMFDRMGGDAMMPVHFGSFELSDEPEGEPMRRLLAAAGRYSRAIVGGDVGASWTRPS